VVLVYGLVAWAVLVHLRLIVYQLAVQCKAQRCYESQSRQLKNEGEKIFCTSRTLISTTCLSLCTAFSSAYTAHKWIHTGLHTMCLLPSMFLDPPLTLVLHARLFILPKGEERSGNLPIPLWFTEFGIILCHVNGMLILRCHVQCMCTCRSV